MSDELTNFNAWYVDVLRALYPNRDAGIAVLMISLPLLERYLRQKNGLGPDQQLDDGFRRDLCAMFPALGDEDTARQFWNVYRHGFLHQVTVAQRTQRGTALPGGWLTHDISEAVRLDPDEAFCVHPVLFSQTVTAAIEADFAAFAGVVAGAPPLPVVVRRDPFPIPSSYMGTGSTYNP
jgi:hypothetical protein